MKKIITIALLSFLSVSAFAGVESIRSNGSKGYKVECTNGNDYIIYRSGGSWYRGDIGHMGNKYN